MNGVGFFRYCRLPTCLALTLLCGGCLNMTAALRLDPDGSGELDLTYSVSSRFAQELSVFGRLQEQTLPPGMPDQAGSRPLFDMVDRFRFDPASARLNFLLPAGAVALHETEHEFRKARKQITVKLGFTSLADLAGTRFFAGYRFRVRQVSADTYALEIRAPDGVDLPGQVQDLELDTQKTLEALLAGFAATISVSVPGDIREADSARIDGRTAIWAFDFDEDPRAAELAATTTYHIVFSAPGLTLEEVDVGGTQSGSRTPKSRIQNAVE